MARFQCVCWITIRSVGHCPRCGSWTSQREHGNADASDATQQVKSYADRRGLTCMQKCHRDVLECPINMPLKKSNDAWICVWPVEFVMSRRYINVQIYTHTHIHTCIHEYIQLTRLSTIDCLSVSRTSGHWHHYGLILVCTMPSVADFCIRYPRNGR